MLDRRALSAGRLLGPSENTQKRCIFGEQRRGAYDIGNPLEGMQISRVEKDHGGMETEIAPGIPIPSDIAENFSEERGAALVRGGYQAFGRAAVDFGENLECGGTLIDVVAAHAKQ